MQPMYYIGLDVHKRTISYCVKDSGGTIHSEGSIPATRFDLDRWMKTLPQPWTAAMEATMFTGWIYDHLKPQAAALKVAHPLMLRAIAAAKKKNDRIDASKICDCLRCDFLPECYLASTAIRERRRTLRYRNLLVRQMVQMKNKIGMLLMKAGVRYNKQRLHKAGYFRELLATNPAIDRVVVSFHTLVSGRLKRQTMGVQLPRLKAAEEEILTANVDPAGATVMNKRTFIKLFGAVMASLAFSRLSAWASENKLKNWAGNLEYSTDRLYSANSLEQVRNYVKKENQLKVLGTRHCFNNIADSTHSFLSLKSMDEVVALDPVARKVTVSAGMTYGQLCPYLDSKGLALHNLASLPHISIAGACSTATHGSGEKNGNLATAVSALEIVTAAGDVVKVSRQQDGEAFGGTVVGLGALGVITKVTLDIQPTFMMRQYVYENLPLAAVKDHFDAIEASAYSVSLFTDWQNQRFSEVWIKSRDEAGQAFDATPEFFGAKRATKNLHPIAELSAENCTEQLGVPGPWFERLPHFRMGFTPSAGKELQSEYFVPRQHAVEAILAVERLRDQITPHLMITEIRAIAADNLWMSPCYEQDCVTIHFTWKQDWTAVKSVLPVIEKELAPFKARPHWGKLFTTSPDELKSIYRKLPEFIQLCKKYDPQGKFRNDFLNTNIFRS